MKKALFLSFRPEYFRPLLYGIKKYEYRKRFTAGPATAYLYLSAPLQEVVGIVELGQPLQLAALAAEYGRETEVSRRISLYLDNKENWAIPIQSLQLLERPVSLRELQGVDPQLRAPRSYLLLANNLPIFDYLQRQKRHVPEFVHDHERIHEDNLAVSCTDMEATDLFRQLDLEYRSRARYDIVKG